MITINFTKVDNHFNKKELIKMIDDGTSINSLWHNTPASNPIRSLIFNYLVKRNMVIEGKINYKVYDADTSKVVLISVPRENPETKTFEKVSGIALAMPIYLTKDIANLISASEPISPIGYELIFLCTIKESDYKNIANNYSKTPEVLKDQYLGNRIKSVGTVLPKTIKYRLINDSPESKCYVNFSSIQRPIWNESRKLIRKFVLVDGIFDALCLQREADFEDATILSSLGTANFSRIAEDLQSFFTNCEITLVADYDKNPDKQRKGDPAKYTAHLAAKRVKAIKSIYLPNEESCKATNSKDYSDFFMLKEKDILETHYNLIKVTEYYKENNLNEVLAESCRIEFNIPENNTLSGNELLLAFLKEITEEGKSINKEELIYTSTLAKTINLTVEYSSFKKSSSATKTRLFLQKIYERNRLAALECGLTLPETTDETIDIIISKIKEREMTFLKSYSNPIINDPVEFCKDVFEMDVESLTVEEVRNTNLDNSLVIILAPTGGGKSTIARELLAEAVKDRDSATGLIVTSTVSNKTHQIGKLNKLLNANSIIDIKDIIDNYSLIASPLSYSESVSDDVVILDSVSKKLCKRIKRVGYALQKEIEKEISKNTRIATKRAEHLSKSGKSIAVCLPSIPKLKEIFTDFDFSDKKDFVMLLDDAEQLYSSMSSMSYPLERKGTCTGRFYVDDSLKAMVNKSNTCFMTAAYLSVHGLFWALKDVSDKKRIIFCKLPEESNNKKVFNCYESLKELQGQLVEDVKNITDKGIAVCVDSKKTAETIKNLLISNTKIELKDIIVIQNTDGEFSQSTQGDNFIRNVDKLSKNCKVLITTSKIKEGVSIENNYFTKVYAVGSSHRVLTVEDFYQMVSRFRGATDIKMYMYQSKCYVGNSSYFIRSSLEKIKSLYAEEIEIAEQRKLNLFKKAGIEFTEEDLEIDLESNILAYEVGNVYRKKYPYLFLEMLSECTKDVVINYVDENVEAIKYESDIKKVVSAVNNNKESYHPKDISNRVLRTFLPSDVEDKAVLDTASGKTDVKAFILENPSVHVPVFVKEVLETEYTSEDYIAYRSPCFTKKHLNLMEYVLTKNKEAIKNIVTNKSLEREFVNNPAVHKAYKLLPYIMDLITDFDIMSKEEYVLTIKDINNHLAFESLYNYEGNCPVYFRKDEELLQATRMILKFVGFSCKISDKSKFTIRISDRVHTRIQLLEWIKSERASLSKKEKELIDARQDRLSFKSSRDTFLASFTAMINDSIKKIPEKETYNRTVIKSFCTS